MTSQDQSFRVSRRSLMQFAGASAGAAALAHGAGLHRGVFAQDEAEPTSGGTLRVGRLVDIRTPDQALMTAENYIMTAQIYNALIRYDQNQQPVPELAESWEQSADGAQLEIKLRQGVLFHTGREFTSEDVRYNLERVRNPELGMSQLRTMSEWVTEIQTPDASTVVFTLDQPRAAILDLLGYLFIVDRETAEGPDSARLGVGTGPFTFAEWAPGDRVRFEKFPNYWQEGRPYLDEIVVQIISDPQALVVQLESGAIDMAELLPEREAARLRENPDYEVILNNLSGQFYYMAFNTTIPELGDKRVRQAINHAIDRQYFVDELLAGIGNASAIPWPPHSAAYDEEKKDAYPYDLERTQALLEEAGVSDLSLEIITSPAFPVLAQLSEVLQADLATAGVDLSIRTPEIAAWGEESTSVTYGGMTTSTFAYADLEPSSLLVMAVPWRPGTNLAGFQSEEYEQMVQAAAAEMDPARRDELYAELTGFLLDESFVMPLSQRLGTIVLRSNAHGAEFRVNTTQGVRLENAWVDA